MQTSLKTSEVRWRDFISLYPNSLPTAAARNSAPEAPQTQEKGSAEINRLIDFLDQSDPNVMTKLEGLKLYRLSLR